MHRVAVIGCGGSSKTTLASALARRLRIPVVHIDSHYWRQIDGERFESAPEQWAACHHRLIATNVWVMDGMKLGVLDERLARADTVIYQDLGVLAVGRVVSTSPAPDAARQARGLTALLLQQPERRTVSKLPGPAVPAQSSVEDSPRW